MLFSFILQGYIMCWYHSKWLHTIYRLPSCRNWSLCDQLINIKDAAALVQSICNNSIQWPASAVQEIIFNCLIRRCFSCGLEKTTMALFQLHCRTSLKLSTYLCKAVSPDVLCVTTATWLALWNPCKNRISPSSHTLKEKAYITQQSTVQKKQNNWLY